MSLITFCFFVNDFVASGPPGPLGLHGLDGLKGVKGDMGTRGINLSYLLWQDYPSSGILWEERQSLSKFLLVW